MIINLCQIQTIIMNLAVELNFKMNTKTFVFKNQTLTFTALNNHAMLENKRCLPLSGSRLRFS